MKTIPATTPVCVAAVALSLAACGGGGGASDGPDTSSERARLESNPATTMVDRVIFEQAQQKGIFQESEFSRVEFLGVSEGPGVSCQELDDTDQASLRSDFRVQSSGAICATVGSEQICYGQREAALYFRSVDGPVIEILNLTSDELGSVATFQVGYSPSNPSSLSLLNFAALTRDPGCTEANISTVFSQADIEGSWRYRAYRGGSSASLPALEVSGQATCTTSQCSAGETFVFGPLQAVNAEGGMVINGSMTYLGATYGVSRAVLSTDLNTLAILACPAAARPADVMTSCRFFIGERSNL